MNRPTFAVPGAVSGLATGGLGGQIAGVPGAGESVPARAVGALRGQDNPFGLDAPAGQLPPKETERGIEPHVSLGGGTETSGTDQEGGNLLAEALFRQNDGLPKQPEAYYEPEGRTYTPTGGKKLYDEAFTNAPGRRTAALNAEADVNAQKYGALEQHYADQAQKDQAAMAAFAARRQQEQEEILQRQQALDKATQFYSQDLADTGKFWHSPANIIGAISASLLAMNAPGDPSIGVRLVNQAIDRDMAQRQNAANMHLGALRSNLAGYQKIAGDREAGDLLAQSEAHRMAAQEVARISARFEGPLAQKRAQVIIEDQNTKAAALQMEFYNRYNHINPSKMDKGLHNARAIGGTNGWTQLGGEDVSPVAAAQGVVDNTHTTANTGDTGKFSKGVTPAQQAVLKVGGAPVLEKVIENRAMSNNDVDVAVKRLAMAEANRKYHGAPGAWEKYLAEMDDHAKGVAEKLQPKAQTRALVAGLRSQLDIVAKSESQDGRDVEDFISWSRKNMPQSWLNQYDQLNAKSHNGDERAAEELARRRSEAGRRLYGRIAAVMNEHRHELFGGSQTAPELASGAKEITENSPIGDIRQWLDVKSASLQREYEAGLVGLPPLAKVLVRKRLNYGNNTGKLSAPGMPGPAQAPAPKLEGQVSGPGQVRPPSTINPSFTDSTEGIVNTGKPR